MDRHGNGRIYYRRKGQPKVRLPAPIGSPEFLTAYKAAQAGAQQAIEQPGLPRIKSKSLRWLCVEYFKSPGYKRLAPRTQKIRRRFLERLCDRIDTKGRKDGDKPYALLEPRHVHKWRDERQARLVLALGLYTTQRRSDLVKLGRQHIKDGYTQNCSG